MQVKSLFCLLLQSCLCYISARVYTATFFLTVLLTQQITPRNTNSTTNI